MFKIEISGDLQSDRLSKCDKIMSFDVRDSKSVCAWHVHVYQAPLRVTSENNFS
jgi:hypothetical protein